MPSRHGIMAPQNHARWVSSIDSTVCDSAWDASGSAGSVYLSKDSGATWMLTGAPSNFWSAVASSADGSRLVVAARSSARTPPRSFNEGGLGTVAGFCARKAPGLRNGNGTAISKREARSVVVCGTTVMRSRSSSTQPPLNTSAGRTFSTMPKSTSQISPRLGLGFIGIKSRERYSGGIGDVIIGQRFRVHAAITGSNCISYSRK